MDSTLGTVLVVGGSGFIGSHIAERLLSESVASSIIITSRNPKTSDVRIKSEALDIASVDAVTALFSKLKPSVVIHTVSPHHLAPASELHDTNIAGTRNLLESAKACPETKAFVYTSSDSACYPSPFKRITESECELYDLSNFNNPYGQTKAVADAMVLATNCDDLKTSVLRVPLVYGPRDRNFVPQVVAAIRTGQHVQQLGKNEKMWEYCYVENAAHAHILAAKGLLSSTPGVAGAAFFITDDSPLPFFSFNRKACAAAGHPVDDKYVKTTPFWVVQLIASAGEWAFWIGTLGAKRFSMSRQEIDHLDSGCWWNIEKAKSVLGYEPIVNQEEGLKLSMQWGLASS